MGVRIGGRQKGTPNKRTALAAERLAQLGCDPLEGMVKIVQDEKTPLDIRASMLKELVQYIHPKLRSTEVDASPTMQTWADLVRQSIKGGDDAKADEPKSQDG